jgi:DNA-binding MarR family transcriptional regulator
VTAEEPPSEQGQTTASRVVTGLSKVAMALRAHDRQRSGHHGLHPTQAQILALLAARPRGLRLGQLATQLGVTSATTSDSVTALERKHLVRRSPSPGDARAIQIDLTAAGQREATAIREWPDAMLHVVDDLDDDEQALLLRLLVKMIRSLQERRAIPAARMCATCQFFDPYAHAGSDKPHHCRFVDAPFADQDLRLDCVDHETAAADVQEVTWLRFTTGRPSRVTTKPIATDPAGRRAGS